jgi:hypothetical protein
MTRLPMATHDSGRANLLVSAVPDPARQEPRPPRIAKSRLPGGRNVVLIAYRWTRNDRQPSLRQPAFNDRPVPRQAVIVHRMRAENGRAVMPAHHPSASGCAKKGTPDRVDAGGANVEALVVLHFGFPGLLSSGIITGRNGYRLGSGRIGRCRRAIRTFILVRGLPRH